MSDTILVLILIICWSAFITYLNGGPAAIAENRRIERELNQWRKANNPRKPWHPAVQFTAGTGLFTLIWIVISWL